MPLVAMNEEVQPLKSLPGVFCNLLDEARVTSGTDILLNECKITIRIQCWNTLLTKTL